MKRAGRAGRQQGRAAVVAALVATAILIAPGAWAGAPASPESRVRSALRGVLTPREVERLLARPGMVSVLDELVRGMDGEEDELRAVRDARGVTVEVTLRRRDSACLPGAASGEVAAPSSECGEVLTVEDRRELRLDSALWRPPPRVRPPPEIATEAPAPEVPAVPLPTVLRRDPTEVALAARGGLRAELVTLLASHDQDVARLIRDAATRDPVRQTEPDPAVVEPPAPVHAPLEGGRIMAALADPYGPGRLRSDLPTPEFGPRWSREPSPAGPPPVPVPSEACIREVEQGADADSPPRLDCYRAVTQQGLLQRRGVAKIVRPLALLSKLIPLVPVASALDAVVAGEEKLARDYRVGSMIWVFAWLDWAERRPSRRTEATHGLDDQERSVLRTRLWRLWRHPDIPRYAALVTELYEEHLTSLYPWIAGADGLPRRDRAPTAWLWASNWLHAVAHRPAQDWEALAAALTPQDRGILEAAASHPRLASMAGPFAGPHASK